MKDNRKIKTVVCSVFMLAAIIHLIMFAITSETPAIIGFWSCLILISTNINLK